MERSCIIVTNEMPGQKTERRNREIWEIAFGSHKRTSVDMRVLWFYSVHNVAKVRNIGKKGNESPFPVLPTFFKRNLERGGGPLTVKVMSAKFYHVGPFPVFRVLLYRTALHEPALCLMRTFRRDSDLILA